MVTFNHTAREMVLKIVYYGPGLCGKTTNLITIHDRLPEKDRTKMVSINTDTDRTLFFDMMGIKVGTIGGFKTKVQVFTVPGQVFYNETRKLVLNGADGVVFVADSQSAVMDSNQESLENLAVNLKKNGYAIETMPLVFQWNKQDMPSALPPAELASALNPEGRPAYAAVATTGKGVFETLKSITKLAVEDVRLKYFVDGRLQEDRMDFSGSTPRKGDRRPPVDNEPEASNQPAETPSEPANATPGAEHLDLNGVDENVARGLVESHRHDPVNPQPEVPEEAVEVVAAAAAHSTEAGSDSLGPLNPELLAEGIDAAIGSLAFEPAGAGASIVENRELVPRLLGDDQATEPDLKRLNSQRHESDDSMCAEIAALVIPEPTPSQAAQAFPTHRPMLAVPSAAKPLALPRAVAKLPALAARPAALARPVLPRIPAFTPRGQNGKCVVIAIPQSAVIQGKVLKVSVSISEGEKILGQVQDSILVPGDGESTSMTLRISQERA